LEETASGTFGPSCAPRLEIAAIGVLSGIRFPHLIEARGVSQALRVCSLILPDPALPAPPFGGGSLACAQEKVPCPPDPGSVDGSPSSPTRRRGTPVAVPRSRGANSGGR